MAWAIVLAATLGGAEPLRAAVSGGWPRILWNLKSLLETGEPVLAA